MKALVTTGNGGMRLSDVDGPRPRADEALIEVRAMGVNGGDAWLAASLPPGSRLGWDIAGVVLRAAEDGGPPAGSRVLGLADRTGWARTTAVATDRLAPLPDEVSDVEAAALPVAGLTALYVLEAAGPLLGRTVVVTGAGGGVGRALLQLAVAAGARVIALVGSPERAAGLEELGADTVTSYQTPPSEIAHVILDSVGGAVFTSVVQWAGRGSTVITFGNSTKQDLRLPFDWAHHRPGAHIRSIGLFDELTRRPAGPDLATLVRLVQKRRLGAQVTTTAPWEEASAILERIRKRRLHAKAVLLP
jgi:NADPH:quinone reductase-like Zn-dependent oxidoreductase